MSATQALGGVLAMLAGGGLIASAVVQVANNSITGDVEIGLATSGVIALILGYIMWITSQ